MSDPNLAEITDLIRELQEREGIARQAAAVRLELYGAAAISPVLPLLSHEYWAVRFWAARILEVVGDAQAREALAAREVIESDKSARDAMGKAIRSISLKVTRGKASPDTPSPNLDLSTRPSPSPAPHTPPRSRQQLGWHRFEQTESGDWILVLPPYYAWLFSCSSPDIMSASRTGWRDSQHGNNRYAYFWELTPDEIDQIGAFLTTYSKMVIIGMNDHIRPYFSDELDGCICLDFNMEVLETGGRVYTTVGELEARAKYQRAPDALERLGEDLKNAIAWVPVSIMLSR